MRYSGCRAARDLRSASCIVGLGRRSLSTGKAITVSTIGVVTAAAGVQTARQMGQVQLAIAGRLLRIADEQGQAALDLIEAASEGMADAMGEMNREIGQMLDTHA